MSFLSAPSALGIRGLATVSACVPMNNCFLVCSSSVGLMNTSCLGFLGYVIWDPNIQMAAFKIGILDVWSNPSLFRKKLEAGGSLLMGAVWRMEFTVTVSVFPVHFIVDMDSLSQRKLLYEWLYIQSIHWRREIQDPSMLQLWWPGKKIVIQMKQISNERQLNSEKF